MKNIGNKAIQIMNKVLTSLKFSIFNPADSQSSSSVTDESIFIELILRQLLTR